MASNCNNTAASNLCSTCGTPNLNNGCDVGCLDIYGTHCIQYTGENLACANIATGSILNDALCSINNVICDIQNNSGLVKVSDNDPHPDTLLNKLIAGANIILTGIGTGDDQHIRIDSVLGGQIVDQFVKISSIDSTGGFLSDKLSTGQCLSLQKVNPGLNEKLQIVIDWQCVLNQLSQLPGFCTLVQNCIPQAPTVTCPYILLNNPNITGSSATFTWLSSGSSFNFYVDGILQSNMPTSSLTYTINNLSNGSHTVEVVALCNSGTPQRDQQTFLVNTTCPVPSGLNVTLVNGNAGLTWNLDSNSNNGPETIQYKYVNASNWINAQTLPANTTNGSITGLTQNKIYNFQIVNNCSAGGPSPSTPVSVIEFTCPNINLTTTSTSVTYSFVSLGGDIDTYIVTLFDATGNNVIQTKNMQAPFNSTITDTFNGLTSNTSYQVQVQVKAGAYNKACGKQTITTPNVPSCPTMTNINVTIS